MKVLSWDVGILNLAYCLIEYDDNNIDDWKIIDWDLINLTNRNEIKCFECGKNPSLFQEIDNKKIYTCKLHAKNINTIPPTFENIAELISTEDSSSLGESSIEKIDQTIEVKPKKQNQKILIIAGVVTIIAVLVYSFF